MRRRRFFRYSAIALIVICLGCAFWSSCDRRPPPEAVVFNLLPSRSIGEDSGNGNQVAIQPYMVAADYASQEGFFRKLDGYLAAARKEGFIGRKTVVVLPEYLGVWLVVAGEKEAVYRARTTDKAAAIIAASNLPSFVRRFVSTDAPDRVTSALFQMKAGVMAGIYQQTFSRLAREYQVTIVAGSIILPSPQIVEGRLAAGKGALHNVSVVYGPDGRAQEPVVRKTFPTSDEQKFIRAGAVEELPVYLTPAGRLGVLICADSWYPAAYRSLKKKNVEILAVPAFLPSGNGWERLWQGYDGAPAPEDVDRKDEGRLSEGEAWLKYALAGRMKQSGAHTGITVFLRGKLWNLGSDGPTIAISSDAAHVLSREDGAAITNVWLSAE